MTHRLALATALTLVLAACSATPGVSHPLGTEPSSTDTPLSTAPADTSAATEPLATVPSSTDTPLSTAPAGTAAPSDATSPRNDIGNGRPATVTLVLSGTRTDSDGSYSASALTRVCGNAVLNMTGNTRAFDFEFPFEGKHQVEDVSFAANDLVPGASTSTFYIAVAVRTSVGGQPPSTIIDAGKPGSGASGTAQRTEAGGTTTLTLTASSDDGTINMTATCAPRP